ncbi:MAG TPA: glutathione S-transferase family protein [Nevskiaceae bacterium]|nr:glutathione S-transferase family protein [Nevskiaceae bacterium]
MSHLKPERSIHLYGATPSGHAHRVRLFLSLLELPYEWIEVDLAHGAHKRPEFLAKNPFGKVPVIEDGDTTLYDSNAILVYLATKYDAGGSWLPTDPLGAAAVQRWFSLAAGEILHGPGFARAVNLFHRPLDLPKAQALAKSLFTVLDVELASTRFAIGDHPTLADVAGYSYIAAAPEGGIALEAYPHLSAWLARIEALPHFVPMPQNPVGLRAPAARI